MYLRDMGKFRGGVSEHVAMTASLGGTVVLGAAVSLLYGWRLTLAGLAVVPLSVVVAAVVAKVTSTNTTHEKPGSCVLSFIMDLAKAFD